MGVLKRRKPAQPNYQDRLDYLLIFQAFVSVLVGSVALAPDLPSYWIWLLGAVQTATVMAISITRKRMHDPLVDETKDES